MTTFFTFEFITTLLNLGAVVGLLIMSFIILNNKLDIQQRHRLLNKRIDEIQVILERMKQDELIIREKAQTIAKETLRRTPPA